MTTISPKHPSDKRSISATRMPGAEAQAEALIATIRGAQLALARLGAEVDAKAHFVFAGCSSLGDWLVQRGAGGLEARTLRGLGIALRAAPQLEQPVRDGEIDVEKAAAIGVLLADPRIACEADAWIDAARRDPIGVLRRRIKARLEQEAQATAGIVEVSVWVREETRADFARARVIASRKARRNLTDGETFARVVDFYLDKNDPERRPPRRRRAGDTNGTSGSRYVPREVEREILRRSGGRCEFPGCTCRVFLQKAHLVDEHAAGGSREASNLALLCPKHHTMRDAGWLELIAGDANDPVFALAGRVFFRGCPMGGLSREAWEAQGGNGRGPPRDPPGDPPEVPPDPGHGASMVSDRIVRISRRPPVPAIRRLVLVRDLHSHFGGLTS